MMASDIKNFRSLLQILALAYSFACVAPLQQFKFLAYIHVYECFETKTGTPYYDLPLPIWSIPSVFISICKLWRIVHLYRNANETSIVKPVPRFSHHAFYIRFVNVDTYEKASLFELIYERLMIPLTHNILFEYNAEKYRKYHKYDAPIFKKEFLRSRYNLDELEVHDSAGVWNFFAWFASQFPYSLQKLQKFQPKNISDFELKYNVQSGFYHACNHVHWYHKLQALTYDFNAYDRIFCDTFERHGLQRSFEPYWNDWDIYWHRGAFLRDEVLSNFPPDASNAVYYASPKLTFVVLQRNPITWQFVFRPFNKSMWAFLIITYCLFELIRRLKTGLEWIFEQIVKLKMRHRGIFAAILYEDRAKLWNIEERHRNSIETFLALLRITVTAAYSGMILVGILNPLYPRTPETFAELNRTENYYICTAKSSPDKIIEHLRESNILNGVDQTMIKNRPGESPADYLVQEAKNEVTDEGKFYASIMYDDKMNLWMRGRQHIWKVVPFFKKLKPAQEKVLPEMRYVSVAAGATRLHFLIDTLRWVFTAGTWMRWYQLEQNYYRNVVPLIVDRILLKDLDSDRMKSDDESRPLTIHDLFSLFAIEGFGCFLAFFVYTLESWYAEKCLMCM